ncbi:MAG TPA: type I-E CRISPR-associated protein Cas5/CasD [Phycisphaerales bacterium]|nr:type I-E CRISPR-associated protein Cas5/CasD [Phycisphaerales bacterium]
MTAPNTVFVRLEGPLQAWGDTSKFVIRRSMEAPTKSGVLGLVCCAMGLSRADARERLPELNTLAMGVRTDRPGTRWWDYHTVGAGIGMTTAGGKVKTGAQGTLITRREYLADASFLVALQGDSALVAAVAEALAAPKWPVYLGRRSCPPSVPILARPAPGEMWTNPGDHADLRAALEALPWRPRFEGDRAPEALEAIIEWRASHGDDLAPDEAKVWYDSPVCFDPPVHKPRLVMRDRVMVEVSRHPLLHRTPAPPRPRADYRNTEYRARRASRLEADYGLCVFCKNTATTVQHVTYRRAGGNEAQDDLRALCRLCHDAVTMIEYGHGMGLDRIDPCEPRWRDDILRARGEILRFRSEESRRRALREAPERVRREVLEEGEV